MNERFFPESIQYQAVLSNLEKNSGQLKCEICKKIITRKSEFHFDHILAFSKGGKSVLSNCQILCIDCNLIKTDKEMHDFVLEERAKKFVFGDNSLAKDKIEIEEVGHNKSKDKYSKEEIESILSSFILKNGDISKLDFIKEKNNLPSFYWINLYWGGIKKMKAQFGLSSKVKDWNKESINQAIKKFIETKNDLLQSDLQTKNSLPSLPCILSHYPELHNFSEVKEYFGLKRTLTKWTYEVAINAGKIFISNTNNKITQKDLRKGNNLPTMNVIKRLFSTLSQYQKVIGADLSKKNEFVAIEDIDKAVLEYFAGRERVICNQKELFHNFKYSQSTIIKRFESVNKFLQKYGITETNPKRPKFSKQDVDKSIIEYIKKGNTSLPGSKDLARLGLPSREVILRYYDSWQEPFFYFQKLCEKIQ